MSTMTCERIVSTSFDLFPSPKGASIHIAAFCQGLRDAFGNVTLVTPQTTFSSPTPAANGWVTRPEALRRACELATPFDDSGRATQPDSRSQAVTLALPCIQRRTLEAGWDHVTIPALGDNLMQRVVSFRRHAESWWRNRRATVIHFRSIFEGYPLACAKHARCDKLVYEVNGFPSIELKYHYPSVADDAELLTKLQAQEQRCLEAADLIVTVSQTTASLLIQRGVEPHRLRVIPNGVDPSLFTWQPPRPWEGRPITLLYSGTFSAWQGVDLAIEALAQFRRDAPARLVLIGSANPRQRRAIEKLCQRHDVVDQVDILPPTTQPELVRRHHEADVILAPLRPTERNMLQGCCPLKVIEAMASGTPLIASDLPVVRELAEPDRDALLVRPGSAKAIKDALLRLRDQPQLGPQLSAAARTTVERRLTWRRAQEELVAAYREVLGLKVAVIAPRDEPAFS